ncbi:phosphomannomutase/phosphoglucomutase [Jannaschia sp. Os4]|uniref:phosphomannomutase/phosphoglucomutase n=1 Tax=Jannaschia sp. Os4 TaxID=2807617 RepID=UPI00193A2D99|nr:phosphomannomutase/phosphoglucomutase [Jannaschia sp. Os4]MBM2576782.1 phosphomannomutase/phosphoglucomutase [Jannaschia sp. Os4]
MTLLHPSGFRACDARWRWGAEVDADGMRAVGLAFAAQMQARGAGREVVLGRDFRGYSGMVADAVAEGLAAGGAVVRDIGLCLTPTAYFARDRLGVGPVAMVTASHNPNGWTGLKMGLAAPLTHRPADMAELRDMVGRAPERPGGRRVAERGMRSAYLDDLASARLAHPLRVVVACGNGTAGVFAPDLLRRIGAEVVERHCTLDAAFPHHDPNPEALAMLDDLGATVRRSGADLGLAFDGDGDRCGAVDADGRPLFADLAGLLLARALAPRHPGMGIVIDVKSTGLFAADPVLAGQGATVEVVRTGHSHVKARMAETGAMLGIEKSGHAYFGGPLGRGYDDGLRLAVELCALMDRTGRPLADLAADLPRTWNTPTLSPACADDAKDAVAARVAADLAAAGRLGGRRIARVVEVDGARAELEGGAWALVRASSNTPNLVVVCESPTSHSELRAILADVTALLRRHPEVGRYDQDLPEPPA